MPARWRLIAAPTVLLGGVVKYGSARAWIATAQAPRNDRWGTCGRNAGVPALAAGSRPYGSIGRRDEIRGCLHEIATTSVRTGFAMTDEESAGGRNRSCCGERDGRRRDERVLCLLIDNYSESAHGLYKNLPL